MDLELKDLEKNISDTLHASIQVQALLKIVQDGLYHRANITGDEGDVICALEIVNKEINKLVEDLDTINTKYYHIMSTYLKKSE